MMVQAKIKLSEKKIRAKNNDRKIPKRELPAKNKKKTVKDRDQTSILTTVGTLGIAIRALPHVCKMVSGKHLCT